MFQSSSCAFTSMASSIGSDIVKLYDLITLCEEAAEEKCQNPFTLPVDMLLYKVASNMMLKKSQNRKHYGTIGTLLWAGGSEDSYSDEEAQEDLPEDSHENGSCSTTSDPQDDSKAVAIIKSVGSCLF